ncbi:MAG: DUF6352 family protein [Burkholderiaceae bacterium]
MHDFWPSSGLRLLGRDDRGWLTPTDAWLRRFLDLPELQLEDGSCRAERALHAALEAEPMRPVGSAEVGRLADADVQANYTHFLGFRDALLAAGTLEAYYLGLIRSGAITVPPLFIDLVVEPLVHRLVQDSTDAFEVRAAELLFRLQRVSVRDGQVLCADAQQADLLNQTGGFGDLGRLLVQNKAPLKAAQMAVLGPDTAADYWHDAERHAHLLVLDHDAVTEIGHGLLFTTRRPHSGLAALARVLERWVAHLLGVQVRITPQQKIADDAWRWHIGLDATASVLLDDLYLGHEVALDRLRRLVGLFRLDFADPREMQPELAGKPVYLGLATSDDGTLRLKPQNLLLNLPLARAV